MEEAERDPGLEYAADFRFRSKGGKCERKPLRYKNRKKIKAKPAHPRVRRSFRVRSKRGICEQNRLR
jgi:hypothetical protein